MMVGEGWEEIAGAIDTWLHDVLAASAVGAKAGETAGE